MRLRLYAPLSTAGLRVDPSHVTQDLVSYVDWWTGIARLAGGDLSGVEGVGLDIARCDFMHARPLFDPQRVQFSDLDTSTDLPLCQFEVLITVPMSSLGSVVEHDAWKLRESPPPETVLVVARSFADDVGHVDCELAVAALQSASHVDDKTAARRLENMAQQVGEKIAALVSQQVFSPLARFMEAHSPTGWMLVDHQERPLPPRLGTGVARWVSRGVLMEQGDPPAELDLGKAWLEDVCERPETLTADIADPEFCEATWINWFAREGSYDNDATLDRQFQPEALTQRRPVRFLSPRFEALLYAQVFYAAFDSVQTGAAQILTKSFSTSREAGLRHDRQLLDQNIRDLSVLLMHYDDALRYFARPVKQQFDLITESWDFNRTSRAVAVERIRACEKRLEAISEEVAENNSRFTDLLLQAIGFTTIIDLMLNIASYGRATRGDVGLATYERTSWFNIAAWLGGASTDTILISGVLLALGFVFVYSVLRSDR